MFDPWQLRTLSELHRHGTMAAVAEAISLTLRPSPSSSPASNGKPVSSCWSPTAAEFG